MLYSSSLFRDWENKHGMGQGPTGPDLRRIQGKPNLLSYFYKATLRFMEYCGIQEPKDLIHNAKELFALLKLWCRSSESLKLFRTRDSILLALENASQAFVADLTFFSIIQIKQDLTALVPHLNPKGP